MALPKRLKAFLYETGGLSGFAGWFFTHGVRPRYEFREFVAQCYAIGYRSLPLVALTGFIMGLVLTMQLYPALAHYGIQGQLPNMVSIAIIREIGPVITALIFAGKIGSSIGAELGSMKATEQIDAMEVSGTNPFKYLVATRVASATLMLPLLVIISDSISLYGAYLGMNMRSSFYLGLFFRQVFANLGFRDILPAFIKTFCFGFAVGMVGCYKGYNSTNGTQGVGLSANSAVVLSSILIFVIDLLAVQVTNLMSLN